jgi:IS30 family transposase
MQSTPSKRYQQLQPEHRVTLASLVQQKIGVRVMPPASD